ncbi:MAG: hypothetical protein WC854_05670 [Bacteroidales bacterium]
MDNIKIDIPVLTDDNGFVGRECPECEQYFKVKFGTGLVTDECICPYCGHKNNQDHFYTKDQIKYIESYVKKYAFEQILKPGLRKIDQSFKNLEHQTRNSMLQIKVKTNVDNIKYTIDCYQESELETNITCNSCNLEFSIFGVFANCPDCGQLSAITVFKKSLEVVKRKLKLSTEIEDNELKISFLEDALNNSISTFDSLGKALIQKHDDILKTRSLNLFQNISLLSETLKNNKGKSISQLIGNESYEFLLKMFQVRHIYGHNFGEIDEIFAKRLPKFESMIKRKYVLHIDEINSLIMEVEKLGEIIIKYLDE